MGAHNLRFSSYLFVMVWLVLMSLGTRSFAGQAPVAQSATINIKEDEFISVTLFQYITDADSTKFTCWKAGSSQGSYGMYEVKCEGRFVLYKNYTGSNAWFDYYVKDESGNKSNVARISFAITPVNDAPIAENLALTLDEDNTGTVALKATDVENSPLNFRIETSPQNGSVSLSGNTVTYKPTENYFGMDTFTYVANDGELDSAPATVSVTVNSINDAPVAQNAAISVAENAWSSFGVTATDVDGDPLTYTIVTQPLNSVSGSVNFVENMLAYAPVTGFYGVDQLTYSVSDGAMTSNIATVTYTVTPVYEEDNEPSGRDATHESTTTIEPLASDCTDQAEAEAISAQVNYGLKNLSVGESDQVALSDENGVPKLKIMLPSRLANFIGKVIPGAWTQDGRINESDPAGIITVKNADGTTRNLSVTKYPNDQQDMYIALAAYDLQAALNKITGADQTADPTDGFQVVAGFDFSNGILLGTKEDYADILPGGSAADPLKLPSAVTEALQADEKLHEGGDAFYIHTRQTNADTQSGRIAIVANKGIGISHGVQRLLHEFGYRKFLQSKNWEIYPSQKQLSAKLHLTDRPAFWYRDLYPVTIDANFGKGGLQLVKNDVMTWDRVMRQGISTPRVAGHAYTSIISSIGETTMNQHPEWILGFGTENKDGSQPDPEASVIVNSVYKNKGDGKLDPSYENLREAIYLKYFKPLLVSYGDSGDLVVSMEPNDSGGWFLDDLYDPHWICEMNRNYPEYFKFNDDKNCEDREFTISDHAFALSQDMLRRADADPDVAAKKYYVGQYGYSFTDLPPSFKLDSRFRVYIATAYCKSRGCSFMNRFELWREAQPDIFLGIRSYFGLESRGNDRPPSKFDISCSNLRQFFYDNGAALNVRGMMNERTGGMAGDGIGVYLYYQALWNPLADFGAIKSDYYNKAFGPAASKMKEYVEMMHGGLDAYTLNSIALMVQKFNEADMIIRQYRDELVAKGESTREADAIVARMNDFKQYWYFQYLGEMLDYGDVAADSPEAQELKLTLRNHYFRSSQSSMVTFMAWYQRLDRYGLATWASPKPYVAPVYPETNFYKSSGCFAYKGKYYECTQPDWTADRLGYSDDEINGPDGWWQKVMAYYVPYEFNEIKYDNDLVPVSDFKNFQHINSYQINTGIAQPGTVFNTLSKALAWSYAFPGDQEVVWKIFNRSNSGTFVYTIYNSRDEIVKPLSEPIDLDSGFAHLITYELGENDEPGAYRLVVTMLSGDNYVLKPKPGYPMSFGTGYSKTFGFFPMSSKGIMNFYVPTKNPETGEPIERVESEFSVSGGSLMVQSSIEKDPDTGLYPTTYDFYWKGIEGVIKGITDITSVVLFPEEEDAGKYSGRLWNFMDTGINGLMFYNIPNVLTNFGAFLMLPKSVVESDGLVPLTEPYPPQTVKVEDFDTEIEVSAKFLGDYEETLESPEIPVGILPPDYEWDGSKSEVYIFRKIDNPSVWMIKIENPSNDPEMSQGNFFIFDENDVALEEWYVAISSDTGDLFPTSNRLISGQYCNTNGTYAYSNTGIRCRHWRKISGPRGLDYTKVGFGAQGVLPTVNTDLEAAFPNGEVREVQMRVILNSN